MKRNLKMFSKYLLLFIGAQALSAGTELAHQYLSPQKDKEPATPKILYYWHDNNLYYAIDNTQHPGTPVQNKTNELKISFVGLTTGTSAASGDHAEIIIPIQSIFDVITL